MRDEWVIKTSGYLGFRMGTSRLGKFTKTNCENEKEIIKTWQKKSSKRSKNVKKFIKCLKKEINVI